MLHPTALPRAAKQASYFVSIFAISLLQERSRANLNFSFLFNEIWPVRKRVAAKRQLGEGSRQSIFLERIAMSHYLHGQSAAALSERPPVFWPIFCSSAIVTVRTMMRTWAKRRQHRQELRDYVAIDHRATADMGITSSNARDWAKRPFWRP